MSFASGDMCPLLIFATLDTSMRVNLGDILYIKVYVVAEGIVYKKCIDECHFMNCNLILVSWKH